jgi:SAM-dependent methyltransferase
VLDLGCGIGRVSAALAPRCRSVLGLDVSPNMVAEARRRHGVVPGLRFDMTSGTGLGALASASSDLVLAVDSFPYVMQAGRAIADRHLADAARVLRPGGGALAILNLSYRGDLDADRADAVRWAAAGGWALAINGAAPFVLWDGAAFLLRRS